jgi:uncharacterized protein YciI
MLALREEGRSVVKFVVLFEDNPGTAVDVRAKHMPHHLAFLERHSANVEAAGPLKDQDGSGAGGKTPSGQPACGSQYEFCRGRKSLQVVNAS